MSATKIIKGLTVIACAVILCATVAWYFAAAIPESWARAIVG